jgi:Holliday junction resolvase RusA-like endonuclease
LAYTIAIKLILKKEELKLTVKFKIKIHFKLEPSKNSKNKISETSKE